MPKFSTVKPVSEGFRRYAVVLLKKLRKVAWTGVANFIGDISYGKLRIFQKDPGYLYAVQVQVIAETHGKIPFKKPAEVALVVIQSGGRCIGIDVFFEILFNIFENPDTEVSVKGSR